MQFSDDRARSCRIQVHPGRDATSPITILRELQDAGADMSRVIMCHMDRTIFTQEGALEIARTGCYMEYDLFGEENGVVFLPRFD